MEDDTLERATHILKESQAMIAAMGSCDLQDLFAAHGLDYEKLKAQAQKVDGKLSAKQREEFQKRIQEILDEQKRSIDDAVAGARRETLIRKRGGLRSYA